MTDAQVSDVIIGGDMVDIPPGAYPATVTSVETTVNPRDNSTFRVWTFVLDKGNQVDGTSSLLTGPKSKTWQWASAILGGSPKGVPLSSLAGKRCIVTIVEGASGYPKVDQVLPYMDIVPTQASQTPPPLPA